MSGKDYHGLFIHFFSWMGMGLLILVLVACDPVTNIPESRLVITETINASETEVVSLTREASVTPENSPAATATATLEFTATPEVMTQEEVRADILALEQKAGDLLEELLGKDGEI